jgi:CubicO group peptidase (beta-lactamase class C family)
VKISLRVLLLVCSACFLGPTWAQVPEKPTSKNPVPLQAGSERPAPITPAAPHTLERADLEAFFDGIIPLQLERSDIAGSTVLVMKDGQVLLQKGYGYSDWEKKKLVDPQTTMFRLASISKLFTWVSVMQLVEQGKLNIDTDINQYLDFQIAPAFGKPITLRNLMTHSGGFEEVIRDLIMVNPKNSPSLRDFLVGNQPRRMYPPGEVSAYSNYGVGLAGYIVQRTSGEPFENYVEDHIFQPLGMAHTSFRQPLSPALAPFISDGYRSSTEKPAIGFEILNPAPAGGLSSSAPDMGRFAQALLNGGELEGHRILKPETVAEMWTRQFAASDRLPAMCMGFYQFWRNNLRFIGHEGDLIAFHSLFFLEPREKLVLFVSYNSVGSESKARDEILRSFADRYYPGDSAPELQKASATDLESMAGSYESTRRAESTKMKIAELLADIRVSPDHKAGVLRINNFEDLRGHEQKWQLGKDGLWHEQNGQDLLYGIRDSRGKVVRLAFDFAGQQLQRLPWYEEHRFVYPFGGASVAILLAVVLAVLLRFFRAVLLPNRPAWQAQPGTLRLTFAPRAAAFAWTILLAYLGTLLSVMMGPDALVPTHESDKYFMICNLLAGLAIFASIFAVISGLRIWRREELRRISQVKFSLVALACVFLTWFSIHWNVIGPAHRF